MLGHIKVRVGSHGSLDEPAVEGAGGKTLELATISVELAGGVCRILA